MIEETGSFRDPAGKIFYHENKIIREINPVGKKRIDFFTTGRKRSWGPL